MAFKATLEVKGKKYGILNCSFSFFQGTDFHGQPAGIVRGGTINVTVEIPQDDPYTLWEWAGDSWSYVDGDIKFMDPESKDKVLVELKFTKGFVFQYAQGFHRGDTAPVTAGIGISAATIDYDGVKHDNSWVKGK